MNISDLLSVSIDFDQSHLFFPRIVHWVLLVLLLLIIVSVGRPYFREVRAGRKSLPFKGPFDLMRFFGTVILTILYFVSMEYVGRFFPNTGLGFLIMSIPYMWLLSILYVHQRDRRHLIMITLNSFIAPVVAWYVLAQLFGITLP